MTACVLWFVVGCVFTVVVLLVIVRIGLPPARGQYPNGAYDDAPKS